MDQQTQLINTATPRRMNKRHLLAIVNTVWSWTSGVTKAKQMPVRPLGTESQL